VLHILVRNPQHPRTRRIPWWEILATRVRPVASVALHAVVAMKLTDSSHGAHTLEREKRSDPVTGPHRRIS